MGFFDAAVEELLQRLLGSLRDLLDRYLLGARTHVTPLTAPHLMAASFDGSTECVLPLRVGVALERHGQNKALGGRLDVRCSPVRPPLHRVRMLLRGAIRPPQRGEEETLGERGTEPQGPPPAEERDAIPLLRPLFAHDDLASEL